MANRLRDFTLSESIFVDTNIFVYQQDACAIGRQFQLFISDATHGIICQQLGIAHIATNDTDMDRVSFLTRWEPRP